MPWSGPRPAPRRRRRRLLFVYGWLSLPAAFFAVFWVWPIVDMFRYSLTNLSALSFAHPVWVGLGNYVHALTDPHFLRAALNTGLYMLIRLPIELPLAMGVALMATEFRRLRAAITTVYFLPVTVSLTAMSLFFVFFYSPTSSPLNYLLQLLHLPPLAFLDSPGQALPSIEAIDLWHGLGYAVILLLAALQNVPPELMEACRIDGGGRWRVFWHVKLPWILPVAGVVVVNDITGLLQLFTPIYVLTNSTSAGLGGPFDSTMNMMTYVYQQAFDRYLFGYASAVSVLLFGVNLLITLLVFRATRASSLWQ